MAKKRRKKKAGIRFSWKPKTFEDADKNVKMARSNTTIFEKGLAFAVVRAISLFGYLDCPSPKDDPESQYRITIGNDNLPQIEKLENGVWVPVE